MATEEHAQAGPPGLPLRCSTNHGGALWPPHRATGGDDQPAVTAAVPSSAAR